MSSTTRMPLADGRTAKPGPDRSRLDSVVLLGADLHQPLAWWTDPLRALTFIVLPIFCAASYFNRFSYWTFNYTRDFVTRETFDLGLYSLAMLLLGVVVGRLSTRRRDVVSVFDGERALRVLVRIGWVAILAYAILLSTLVVHLDIVLDLLHGDATAPTRLRDALGRIPGITSFVQFGTVYLALAATLATMTNLKLTKRIWVMTAFIFGLVFVRSVLASERLALLEALAALVIIPLAYRWKPSFWRFIAPYLGAVFVFIAFAAGEYLRSWQYYRMFYDTYFSFIGPRFLGYFSTSINNGAGAYLTAARYAPHPEITVGWITKFPVLGSFIKSPNITIMDNFLENYATPEFNNPGGLYAAFLDYRFPIASLFMIGIGAVIGSVHRRFQNRALIGMLLYPSIFLGMTDLIRIMYISDTRTLPLFIGAFVTWWAIRPVQLERDRFLSMKGRAAATRQA